MAYIGRQLVRGQNRVLDDISSSFNGSTTAFNLTVSSSSSPPASVNQLWIILGGILQKPGTDFTVADAVITFTTAPASTLSFWGMIQGDTSDINSPADASVTPSKIANSGDFAFPADVRFNDADGSHYVGLQAPSTVSSNLVWSLPAADGSANQLLKTDGSGNLGWASDTQSNLLDEDNMSSNSATQPASQQSIKAYADTKAVLTGSTNNTITTVTGANAIQGEANLTFDGSDLALSRSDNAAGGISVTNTNDAQASGIAQLALSGGDNSYANISLEAGGNNHHIKNDNSGNLYILDGATNRLQIDSTGNVKVSDGDLIIGTSGHGIDFSATSDNAGQSSELLDDYEEGTYIPSASANITLHTTYHTWSYTKIGRQVTIKGLFFCSAISGTDNIALGLPFNAATLTGTANAGPGAVMWSNVTGATAGVSSYIQNGGTELRFYYMTEGTGGWARMANDDISTSTEIYVTHTYCAA